MSDRFDTLDDDELTARLREIEARQRALDAERASVLVAWDRRQAWANDGSVTAAARLARETSISSREARERVRVSGLLASMPHTAAAFGELGWPKVKLLAGALNERTADAFTRHEHELVRHALDLRVDHLAVLLGHWKRLVDADGANADADSKHDSRYVHLDVSWGGDGFLSGRLDPESTQIVKQVLDQIADELYRAEREEARLGALAGDDPDRLRSSSERAAAALVEMARRAAATTDAVGEGATVTPARPLVLVHLDVDVDVDDHASVTGRFADGTPLSLEDATRLACDAAVARVVSKNGSVPLDLGRTTRDPSEAQRRALGALWATCAHPTCDRPFAWCQLHHVVHWEHGGRTDVGLLVPLCPGHHRRHHKGVFDIRRCRDGTFEFARPDGTLIGTANPTLTRLYGRLRDLAVAG